MIFGWLLGRSDAEAIGLESELIGLIGILFLVKLLLFYLKWFSFYSYSLRGIFDVDRSSIEYFTSRALEGEFVSSIKKDV